MNFLFVYPKENIPGPVSMCGYTSYGFIPLTNCMGTRILPGDSPQPTPDGYTSIPQGAYSFPNLPDIYGSGRKSMATYLPLIALVAIVPLGGAVAYFTKFHHAVQSTSPERQVELYDKAAAEEEA
jgi:hypothetical protein